MSFSRPLFILILVAFIFRIAIAVWSFGFRENTDVLRYRDWATIAYLYGFSDTYKPDHIMFGTLANNQPPGTLYIISTAYQSHIQTSKLLLKVLRASEGSVQWINGPLLNAFLRFPAILADLFIAIVIYEIVKSKKSQKTALFSSSLFLFNPSVLYSSSFWGQMDSLNNLFFILALFFILKKKIFWAILCFFASLYIKLSLLFLLPIFFVIVIKMFVHKKSIILISLFASLALITIATLPISSTPHEWIFDFIKNNAAGEMQNITAFAFNFWWMIYMPFIQIGSPSNTFTFSEIRLTGSPATNTVFLGFDLMKWSLVLFSIFQLPLFYKIFQLKQRLTQPKYLFLIFGATSMIGFLFLPRMHERYLYPLFPLLGILVGIRGKFVYAYIILSLLNAINLYLVWHPMLPPYIAYDVMNSQMFQWIISIATVIAGFVFYIKSLKYLTA